MWRSKINRREAFTSRRRLKLKVGLKAQAQGEFHHTRSGEGIRVLAETSLRIDGREGIRCIEAYGVGDVEDFPAECQAGPLGKAPGLSQSHVNAEITWTPQSVAAARFAWERETKVVCDHVAEGGTVRRRGKHVWIAICVGKGSG